MTTTRGYKYRIYPDEKQANLINRTLGCCRFVYNHFLAVRRDEWHANHRGLYYKQTNLLLTELKRRDETCWLREVDSMALQESLRNLDDAYARFFKKQARYPRFKFKHNHTQSYRTRNQSNGIRFENGNLKLPKVGLVRIRLSRAFEGKIKHVTVSRTASGKYFVSLCVEENVSFAPCGKGQIGIDVGWHEFIRELEYKAAWRGARVLKVDTFYPSSQTCGTCGYKNPLMKNLAIREWDCPQCGAHHDRDVNAAQNILTKALEQVA